MTKKNYQIESRETGKYVIWVVGIVINEYETLQQAEMALIDYEEEDRRDGTYFPNFYVVRPMVSI